LRGYCDYVNRVAYFRLIVGSNGNCFLSVVSYFTKRQDKQHGQQERQPAINSGPHSELLPITYKPEPDGGKLEGFVS
jgi:hypothetical protein